MIVWLRTLKVMYLLALIIELSCNDIRIVKLYVCTFFV
jgi:hypothetical protein